MDKPEREAGWYPDDAGHIRWWDGSQWTQHLKGSIEIPKNSNPPQLSSERAEETTHLPAPDNLSPAAPTTPSETSLNSLPAPEYTTPATPPAALPDVSDDLTQEQIEQIAATVLVPDRGNNSYGIKRGWTRLLGGIAVAGLINILINILLLTIVVTVLSLLFLVFGLGALKHLPGFAVSGLGSMLAYSLDANFLVAPLRRIVHLQIATLDLSTGKVQSKSSAVWNSSVYFSLLDACVFLMIGLQRFTFNRLYAWKPARTMVLVIAVSGMIAAGYVEHYLLHGVNRVLIASVISSLMLLIVAPKNFGVRVRR